MIVLMLLLVLFATPAWATTYYVAASGGDDGRSCATAQTHTTALQSLAVGVSCLSGGDILEVKAGTYANQQILNPPSGSTGAYTIIRNFGTDRPLISNAAGDVRGVYISNFFAPGDFHHIEIRGFEFTGVNNIMLIEGSDGVGYPHHVRFIDNLCHDTFHVGIRITSRNNGLEGGDHYIAFNEFYHIGINWDDHPYVPGINTLYGTGSNTIIEHNIFHNVCHAIAMYTGSGALNANIIRYNLFYEVARADIDTWQAGSNGCGAVGILDTGGVGTKVYNNVFYDNGSAGSITAEYGPLDFLIANNTIYNDTGVAAINIGVENGTDGEVRNNIVYNTSGGINLGNATGSNNLTTNPSFVNAGTHDFHLQSGSAARDTGTNLTSAGIVDDYDGVSRPQNGTYDIGAYEFVSGGEPSTEGISRTSKGMGLF